MMMSTRAASLLGLVALFVSCASAPVEERFEAPRPLAGWVDAPPAGCAVGSSGPTLNPRNAIRYARVSAIDALAAGSLSIDVQSITGTGSEGYFEMTAQSLSGVLADARIAALFGEVNPGREGRARLRQVFALACFPDADLSDLPEPGYPRWVVDVPAEEGRVCATGISGPTRKARDQAPSALGDARLALAIALESRIEKRVFDDGRGVARMAREIDPSPRALRRAAGAEALEERWLDEEGEGPLGLPGVLYGLVCVE